jgi:hypothetical protein
LNASTREWLARLLDRPLPEETCVLESEGGASYIADDSYEDQRYHSDEGEEYADWRGYENNSFDDNRDRYRSYDRGYQSTSFYAPPRPKKQATAPSNKAAVYEGRKQSTFGANSSSSSKKSLKLASKRQASSKPDSQYDLNTAGITGVKQEPTLHATDVKGGQKGLMSSSQNESPYDYPNETHVKQETPYTYPGKAENKPSYDSPGQPGSQSFGGFTSAGSLPMDQPFKSTKGSKRKGIEREHQQATAIGTASTSKKAKGKFMKVGNRFDCMTVVLKSDEDD